MFVADGASPIYNERFRWGKHTPIDAHRPLGVMQGRDMIIQMTRAPSERMWWYYAHLGNMIGAGIAFHTAFMVFGANRFVSMDLPGFWQLVPWVLPTAIGLPIQYRLERTQRRRFGTLGPAQHPGATASA